MNLKQLTAFREVMLTGSVSKAAENLYRTQPAVSSLIANLEDDIGFKLFERKGGRLHPVPEAHYLLEEAGHIIDRLDSTERIMKSVRDLERGSIRMVAMPGPSVFLLPDIMSRFVDGRDGVNVSLITRSSIQVQQLIAVQQYDVGLADLGFIGTQPSPLVEHEVVRLKCLCAIPADAPLASREYITPMDLDGEPLAALYDEHPIFIQINDVFSDAGADLKVRFETQYFIPMFTFVERGLAHAIVDPLSAHSYTLYGPEDRIVFRPFVPDVYMVASIMTPAHQPLSGLVRAFIAEVRSDLGRIRDNYGFESRES